MTRRFSTKHRPSARHRLSTRRRFPTRLFPLRHGILAVPLSAAAALALAGCSAEPSSETPTDGDALTVVASTDVWGSIASSVGGSHVEVTSIIDDPDRDPHEYEASARDQLALSTASVVIENGGGYDDVIDRMLASADNDSATTIDAVEVSGKEADAGQELNEHVWYDLPTVRAVVDEIESAYATVDPDHAEAFRSNADDLTEKLEELEDAEADVAEEHSGTPVSITEPVPLYMLEAMGLENRTPEDFSEAIEEDTDVAPETLRETLALYGEHKVDLLVFNEQTAGAQSDAVVDAAKENGIPVVAVTETLPKGEDYVGWMSETIDAVSTALDGQ